LDSELLLSPSYHAYLEFAKAQKGGAMASISVTPSFGKALSAAKASNKKRRVAPAAVRSASKLHLCVVD
jgi:hypothetical protein